MLMPLAQQIASRLVPSVKVRVSAGDDQVLRQPYLSPALKPSSVDVVDVGVSETIPSVARGYLGS